MNYVTVLNSSLPLSGYFSEFEKYYLFLAFCLRPSLHLIQLWLELYHKWITTWRSFFLWEPFSLVFITTLPCSKLYADIESGNCLRTLRDVPKPKYEFCIKSYLDVSTTPYRDHPKKVETLTTVLSTNFASCNKKINK